MVKFCAPCQRVKYALLLMVSVCLSFLTANAAAPVITSLSATTGSVGSSLTINGSGFNVTPTNNEVYFGSVKAPIASANASQITVTVPAGSTYSFISVTNLGTHQTGYSTTPFLVTFSG